MTNTQELSKVPVQTTPSEGSSRETGETNDPFINDEARRVLEILFCVAFNAPIGVIGSAANVINIVIFFKQGFSDAVNVSLCGLALSDFGSLIPLVWVGICYNPLFRNADIGFDSAETTYLTGGLQHACFARITSWITAFITLERCVCIALPLKVKEIITPRRTFIAIITVTVIGFAFNVPIYATIYFAPRFHKDTNKTLVGLAYTADAEAYTNISFSLNVFAQLSSFIIVIICTVVLILKLISKSQWRHKATFLSGTSDSISLREKRVMKMVTFISSIFVICYFPVVVTSILVVHFSSEFSVAGRYVNTFYITWNIVNMIEALNSSTTILVYYNMSSKYRASFDGIFSTDKMTAQEK